MSLDEKDIFYEGLRKYQNSFMYRRSWRLFCCRMSLIENLFKRMRWSIFSNVSIYLWRATLVDVLCRNYVPEWNLISMSKTFNSTLVSWLHTTHRDREFVSVKSKVNDKTRRHRNSKLKQTRSMKRINQFQGYFAWIKNNWKYFSNESSFGDSMKSEIFAFYAWNHKSTR